MPGYEVFDKDSGILLLRIRRGNWDQIPDAEIKDRLRDIVKKKVDGITPLNFETDIEIRSLDSNEYISSRELNGKSQPKLNGKREPYKLWKKKHLLMKDL